MKFANIENEVINNVMNVEIDEFFITNESIKQIRNILNLDGKSVDELRAIRNTIVRTIAEMRDRAFEENNYECFRNLSTKMSGITCAIDGVIWENGGEV